MIEIFVNMTKFSSVRDKISNIFFFLTLCLITSSSYCQNRDPLATEIVTADLNHFWEAFEKAGEQVNPQIIDQYYLKIGSKGVKGFMSGKNQERGAPVQCYKISFKILWYN